MLTAIGAGLLGADPDRVLRVANTPQTVSDVPYWIATIAAHNSLAFGATFVLGVASLGVLSAVILVSNGYALGGTLGAFFPAQLDVVLLMMQYVPLEFAAMLLICNAGGRLGLSLLAWTRGAPGIEDHARIVRDATVAAVLLPLAAVVEGLAGYTLGRLP